MRSRSTRACGRSACSSSHTRQCVVASRPSSRPAAASAKAPVHTLATRRMRGALRASQAPTRCSTMAVRRPGSSPPATMRVSIDAGSASSVQVPARLSPPLVSTVPPAGEARCSR